MQSLSQRQQRPTFPPILLNRADRKDLVARLLDNGPVVLDERVKVIVPSIVENQAQVPVAADARALPGVTQLVVFADYNPIEHMLSPCCRGKPRPTSRFA